MTCTPCHTVVYGEVDQGWAWLVLTAITFWNSVIAGTLKSFGVIYLEFLERYQRGPVLTSWLGFSFSFLSTIFAPVFGYIGDEVSLTTQRILVMTSSIITTLAIAVTGSMTHLEGAIVTYGIAGIAAAAIDSPVLSLIGKYFEERRFLASGVVFAGSSLGTLVMPPVLTALVNYYGVRGAMIIFGGVWLNNCVVGAVIRPLPNDCYEGGHQSDGKDIEVKKGRDSTGTADISNVHDRTKANQCDDLESITHHDLRAVKSLGTLINGVGSFWGFSSLSIDDHHTERHNYRSVPCVKHPEIFVRDRQLPHNGTFDRGHPVSDICTSDRDPSVSHIGPYDRDHSVLHTGSVGKHQDIDEESKQQHTADNSTDSDTADKYSLEADHRVCSRKESTFVVRKLMEFIRNYWSFLKSPGLPLLALTFCISSFAYYNHLFLFPLLAQEVHMTKMEGAFLVSLCNITELVSRLVVGILVDKKSWFLV